MHITIKIEEK